MRWITYFPKIYNIHLTKDLGMLPFYMQNVCDYNATLVGQFPDEEYPALTSEMRQLKVLKLPNANSLFFADHAFLKFLIKNARHIDVLNLYHLSRDTIIYGVLFKMQNPRGKLYLKLDAYNHHLTAQKVYAKSWLKNKLLNFLEKRFFVSVNLISIENRKGLKLALKTYPQWQKKLVYVPNGCNDLFLNKHFDKPFKKERILLSVGRPGSPDKNYELLIRALPLIDLKSWKMIIIGSVSEAFKRKWEEAQRQYPKTTSAITFLGAISDRFVLYSYYQKSAVFFLPSRTESFGIAFAEALYFGNLLVGHSGMAAYSDLAKTTFGIYFEDNEPASFADALHRAMDKCQTPELAQKISDHCANNFHWSSIVKGLDYALRHA